MISFSPLNLKTVLYLEEETDKNIRNRELLEYITDKIIIGSVLKLTAWSTIQDGSHGLIKNVVYFKDKDDMDITMTRKKLSSMLPTTEVANAKCRFIQRKKCSFKLSKPTVT